MTQAYGGAGVPWEIEGDAAGLVAAVRRHRDRLLAGFARLSDDEWRHATRCRGWDALDLAGHLSSSTAFFSATLAAALKGTGTRHLEGFDPVDSPAELAKAMAGRSPADVLAELEQSDRRLADVIDRYTTAATTDGDPWELTAESPPGHVNARLSLQHLFFDSWLHERDLLVPLGRAPAVHADEVISVVAYLLGIAALASLRSLDPPPEPGEVLTVALSDQPAVFEVELGPPTIVRAATAGATPDVSVPAVALAEAMSGRGDLTALVATPGRAAAVLGGALPFLSSPDT